MTDTAQHRLDAFNKTEWRDVCRQVAQSFGRPFDEEQFEKDWVELMEMKRKKALN